MFRNATREWLSVPAGVDLAEPNFARRVGSPSGGAAAAAAAARVAAGGAFSFMPDDPDFLTNNGWHLRRVAAPLAWATTKGSSNVSRLQLLLLLFGCRCARERRRRSRACVRTCTANLPARHAVAALLCCVAVPRLSRLLTARRMDRWRRRL